MLRQANTSLLKDSFDENTLWSMRQMEEQRILIVDDEPMIRNILRTVVEAEGFKADTAQDGQEAVEHLQGAHYQMVLTDMRMPAMNGIELVQILKGHPVYRNIPILAVSGASSRQVRQECLTAGCDDSLPSLSRSL